MASKLEQMFGPTRIGRYGENRLSFVTPDEDNRFSDLLTHFGITEADHEIIAHLSHDVDLVPIHAHIARITRPAEVEADNAPDTFLAIQVFLDDVNDREDHSQDQMLDLSVVLAEIALRFPEPMRGHHRGHFQISREIARPAIELPVAMWTPPKLGQMLGARFELHVPGCDLGHIILDTGEESISASLHFDSEQVCNLETISEGWTTIRGIYDDILLGDEATS